MTWQPSRPPHLVLLAGLGLTAWGLRFLLRPYGEGLGQPAGGVLAAAFLVAGALLMGVAVRGYVARRRGGGGRRRPRPRGPRRPR